jgi:hypothetical protein
MDRIELAFITGINQGFKVSVAKFEGIGGGAHYSDGLGIKDGLKLAKLLPIQKRPPFSNIS